MFVVIRLFKHARWIATICIVDFFIQRLSFNLFHHVIITTNVSNILFSNIRNEVNIGCLVKLTEITQISCKFQPKHHAALFLSTHKPIITCWSDAIMQINVVAQYLYGNALDSFTCWIKSSMFLSRCQIKSPFFFF